MSSPRDLASEFWIALTTSLAGGVIAGVFWFVRRVLTNQKQVEALSAEIALREEHRKEERAEDRAAREEMREDIRQVRQKVDRLAERNL